MAACHTRHVRRHRPWPATVVVSVGAVALVLLSPTATTAFSPTRRQLLSSFASTVATTASGVPTEQGGPTALVQEPSGGSVTGLDDTLVATLTCREEQIYDTSMQCFLPAEPSKLFRSKRFSSELGSRRVVFVGEAHDSAMHHRMQLEMLDALLHLDDDGETNGPAALGRMASARGTRRDQIFSSHGPIDPRSRIAMPEPTSSLAVGVEMFGREHQRVLDQFIFEDGDLEELKARTSAETYDVDNYLEILSWAKDNHVRVIGLNAPEMLLDVVLEVGVENLPPGILEELPQMDLGNKEHRRRFDTIMGEFTAAGDVEPQVKEHMYQCQVLWEEYLAESVSLYLSSKGAAERLVCLTGLNHIIDRDGVPDRVMRRLRTNPFTVVPMSVGWTKNGTPLIDQPLEPKFSDWIWLTPSELEADDQEWI